MKTFIGDLAAFLAALVTVGVIAFLVSGCGPANQPDHFASPPSPIGPWRVFVAENVDRPKVEAAALEHWNALLSLNTISHSLIGQGYPQGQRDVFIHVGAAFNPYMPNIPGAQGYIDELGRIHVVAGSCGTVPDLMHQAAHSHFSPAENHDLAPTYWAIILAEQVALVDRLKMSRGCR